MKTSFTLQLILLTLFTACDEKVTYINLDEDFEENFGYAKNGSWWVFSDTTLGTRDSLYIYEYRNTCAFAGEKAKGDCYQFIEYKLHSSSLEFFAALTVGEQDSAKINSFGFKYKTIEHNDYYEYSPSIEKINDEYRLKDYCSDCGIQIEEVYNTASFVFNNVIKVWENKDTFYFAPQVGLIHYFIEGTDYTLNNYYISN
jgi:hypothetical protein